MDASNANLHNIEKRIGALERAEHPAEKTKVANMAPLGLWAFSLTTAMLQMKNLSVGIPSDNEGVVIGLRWDSVVWYNFSPDSSAPRVLRVSPQPRSRVTAPFG